MSTESESSRIEELEKHHRDQVAEHFPEALARLDANRRNDGFRARRLRPDGWRERAIANGEIRDPNAPDPDAGKTYEGATVVGVPVATLSGEG